MRGIDFLKPCIITMIHGGLLTIYAKNSELPAGFPNGKKTTSIELEGGMVENGKAYCPFEIMTWLLEQGHIDDLYSEIQGYGNVVKGPWSGS